MELHEAIAAVHEAIEGRYDLTGQDLSEIEHFLCQLQKPEEEKHCPIWLTEDVRKEAKRIWDSHRFVGDRLRVKAIKYLQEAAIKAHHPADLKLTMELFQKYSNK
jgi:hypothetical protein